MQSIKPKTIEGFNGFLRQQIADPGYMTFSLYQFKSIARYDESRNAQVDTVYEIVGSGATHELNDGNYQCHFGTPLVDAMGYAIDRTGSLLSALPDALRPERVGLVVLTDGEELHSKFYTREQVKAKIQHQEEKYKWVFTYLGANQDAIMTGATFGFQATRSMSYNMNHVTETLGVASAMYTRSKTADINDAQAFMTATSYNAMDRSVAMHGLDASANVAAVNLSSSFLATTVP